MFNQRFLTLTSLFLLLIAISGEFHRASTQEETQQWARECAYGRFNEYVGRMRYNISIAFHPAFVEGWEKELQIIEPILELPDKEKQQLVKTLAKLKPYTSRNPNPASLGKPLTDVDTAIDELTEQLGPDHLFVVRTRALRANLLMQQGKHRESLPDLIFAAEQIKKQLTPDSLESFQIAQRLAQIYGAMGHLDIAHELTSNLTDHVVGLIGESAPLSVMLRIDLGNLNLKMNRYSAALKQFSQAEQSAPPPAEWLYLHSQLHNLLAQAYQGQHDIENANFHFHKSAEFTKQLFDASTTPFDKRAWSAMHSAKLGVIARNLRQYDKAAEHFEKALPFFAKTKWGAGFYASISFDYGRTEMMRENYSKAAELMTKALSMQESFQATSGDMRAKLVPAIAQLYRYQGKFDQAIKLITDELEDKQRAANRTIAVESRLLKELGLAYSGLSNNQKAFEALRKSFQLHYQQIQKDAMVMDTGQSLLFGRQILGSLGDVYAVADESKNVELLNMTLESKGAATQFLEKRLQILRKPQYAELKETREDLQRKIATAASTSFDEAEIEQLQKEKRDLLLQMQESMESDGYWTAGPDALQILREDLPSNIAVLEFVTRSLPTKNPANHRLAYDVLVITKPANQPLTVKRVALGDSSAIDAAVNAWKQFLTAKQIVASNDPNRGIEPLKKKLKMPEAANSFHRLVWSKLEPELGSVEHVIVCPDGSLTEFPFAAIPTGDPKQPFLIQKMRISYATSAYAISQLLRHKPKTSKVNSRSLCVVGDLDFGDAHREHSTAAFVPLPQAAQEVSQLRSTWKNPQSVNVLSGTQATEQAVGALMQSSQIIYFATHGYLAEELNPLLKIESNRLVQYSPLVASGLALSNANRIFGGQIADGDNDQLLTGEEILTLNLSGVDLVILSACHTGGGVITTGNGAFGVQKAIRLAGAASTISSLYAVGDQSTMELMKTLSQELFAAANQPVSKAVALQRSQIEAIKQGKHPRQWAAWVLYGDWR